MLFPNTVPPFYPSGVVSAGGPTSADNYQQRWAGIQAHNRWLKDFCDLAPGRRGGLAQVFLTDIDDAIAEVRWAKEAGLAGVLIPSDHTTALLSLYERQYDPFWAVCSGLDFPVHRHAVAVTPPLTEESSPFANTVGVHEVNLFFQRGLGHLIIGGVFERFPDLKFVFTEGANVFVSMQLMQLESEFSGPNPGHHRLPALPAVRRKLEPHTDGILPASLLSRCVAADRVGDRAAPAARCRPDDVGRRLPAPRGQLPLYRPGAAGDLLQLPEDEVRAMTSLNAAEVYDCFDLDYLQTIADEIGPTPEEVARPLTADEFPEFTMSISLWDTKMPNGVA